MQIIKFIKANYLYVLWFLIYFNLAWILLGGDTNSFIAVSIVYGISIPLALSPAGEFILRLLENCREPYTEKEKTYLLPLFEEVYQDAKEVYPKLNKGIKLYIMDAMYVNAFAIGRKTVAVTKGAIETFTEDELKGILAHELGHMAYGHSKALLLSLIGNLFFSVIVWFFRFILRIFQIIANIGAFFSFVGIIFAVFIFLLRFLADMSNFVFVSISQMLLALNSRQNEIQADKFAYEVGYGGDLISGMYLLQKISINTKVRLAERLMATHPHIAYRIGKLEELENEAIEA